MCSRLIGGNAMRADLNCNIHVVDIIHKGIAELVQSVMDKTGVAVNVVRIRWIDVSSAGERAKGIIDSIEVETVRYRD